MQKLEYDFILTPNQTARKKQQTHQETQILDKNGQHE